MPPGPVAVFPCSHHSLKDAKVFGVYMRTSKANLTDPKSKAWGAAPCSPLARRPWRASLGFWQRVSRAVSTRSLSCPQPVRLLSQLLPALLGVCMGLLCSGHHAQSWQESLSQHSAGPGTSAGLVLSIFLLPSLGLEAWASCFRKKLLGS